MSLLTRLREPLTGDQVDWMPKQLYKTPDGSVFCQILAYKDARVDRQRLDDVFGTSWQNLYRRDEKGILQCGIGAYVKTEDETYQWIWRWSNGTPSEFEKEKGEYSDAFKRAGFMWGIGIELYDFPSIVINLTDYEWEEKGGKIKAKNTLKPNNWEWTINRDLEDGSILSLVAYQVTKTGKRVLRYDSNPYDSKNPRK